MSGRCGTCSGRGTLRDTDGTAFTCPDCGGVAPRWRTPAGGERVSLVIPARTWEAVREAAALNGRAVKDWAVEALANAARQQLHKHRARQGR